VKGDVGKHLIGSGELGVSAKYLKPVSLTRPNGAY